MEPQTKEPEQRFLKQEKRKELGPNDYHQYYGNWFIWICILLGFLGVIAGLIGFVYVLFFRLL